MSQLIEALWRRHAPAEERLEDAGVRAGMKVADLGAGYGFFAFPAAQMVGDDGIVYAVEPNRKRAEDISQRAGRRGTKNIVVVVSGAENLSALPSGEIDLAMSISSFHHFAQPEKALDEMGRVVKQGGRAYIRDITAGRIFKHGSDPAGFRTVISKQFPRATFEEGKGYVLARIEVRGT